MKRLLYCLMTALTLLLPASALRAQSAEPDVIYTKDGSVIKGTIIEMVRDRIVKIKTADGNIYIYQMADVKNIVTNQQSAGQMKEQPDDSPDTPQLNGNQSNVLISCYGGVSLPTGVFASPITEKDGGAAKTGFGLAADVDVSRGHQLSWMSSVALTGNGTDINSNLLGPNVSVSTGSWTSVWLLTGCKVSGRVSETGELFGFAQIGALFGSSPDISISGAGVHAEQSSASGSGVGYGFGAGLKFERFLIGMRYLGGKPQFEVSASSGGWTETQKFSQPIGCFLLTVGIALQKL